MWFLAHAHERDDDAYRPARKMPDGGNLPDDRPCLIALHKNQGFPVQLRTRLLDEGSLEAPRCSRQAFYDATSRGSLDTPDADRGQDQAHTAVSRS